MNPLQPTSALEPTGTESPANSVQAWARAYICSSDLAFKTQPPPLPNVWLDDNVALPPAPGRPDALRVSTVSKSSRKAQRSAVARAKLLHTFWHHELQAAELMCWAVLRFPDADRAWHKGLLAICHDEIRHMQMYEERLNELGYPIGSFAVRDWFWERVPTCATELQFIALMNLGLEAANLEHATRFAAEFLTAGDSRAASLQEKVASEEISHVAFGRHWFERLSGPLTFEGWKEHLPAPLSPLLMRGLPLNRSARRGAGMPETFLNELEAWRPDTPGS